KPAPSVQKAPHRLLEKTSVLPTSAPDRLPNDASASDESRFSINAGSYQWIASAAGGGVADADEEERGAGGGVADQEQVGPVDRHGGTEGGGDGNAGRCGGLGAALVHLHDG